MGNNKPPKWVWLVVRIILMIIFGAVFLIFVTALKTGEAIGNDIQAISNPLSGVNLKAFESKL